MLGSFFLSSSALLLLLVSCAQPKYEQVVGVSKGNISQNISNCSQKLSTSGHCLLWQWEKVPTATESGVIAFKVVRPNLLDGSPMPVESKLLPSVILWMPSMGHGSSPTVVEQLDVGSYRASEVTFIMPGEWEIKFQWKEGNTVQDESILAVVI